MLKAVISPDWASNIHEADVWRFNTSNAETLPEEVTLSYLGSLAVDLTTSRIATREVIRNARSVQHIINLAFGEPAVETRTSRLLKASYDTFGVGHELTGQLITRNRQSLLHGPDEPWFLPISAVRVIDAANISVTA